MQQMLTMLYDDPPYIPIYDNNFVYAHKPEIRGVVFRVTDIPQFHTGYRSR